MRFFELWCCGLELHAGSEPLMSHFNIPHIRSIAVQFAGQQELPAQR